MQRPKRWHADVLVGLTLLSSITLADIRVGVTMSATGPQALLGQPEKNATTLWPSEVSDGKINVIVLDDASDTTRAVINTRKLMGESNVDVVVGSSTTPNTLVMIDAAVEGETPMVSLASSARLIEPMDARRHWIFKAPYSDSHTASLIAEHIAAHGVKTIAYIGFANALGGAFLMEVQCFADLRHIRVTDTECFSPTNNSVTAQVLHLLADKPDAVVVDGSGISAALPVRTLAKCGHTDKVYFDHDVSNNDSVRLCGKGCEGAYMPTSPVMVAAELPGASPAKRQAPGFVRRYGATSGRGSVSIFVVYTGGIGLLPQYAVPVTLKRTKSDTPTFREALRDALEQVHGLPTSTGVINMSPQDHVGLDQRTRVMAQIRRDQRHLVGAAK